MILTDKISDEVTELAQRLSKESPRVIAGVKEESIEIIDQTNIFRIYSENKKVFAVTSSGEFVVRLRLYELEERLDKNNFVRISNSEIINIRKVKNFDLSFTGTICVSLLDGTVTYVSRRYVAKIKQLLGI